MREQMQAKRSFIAIPANSLNRLHSDAKRADMGCIVGNDLSRQTLFKANWRASACEGDRSIAHLNGACGAIMGADKSSRLRYAFPSITAPVLYRPCLGNCGKSRKLLFRKESLKTPGIGIILGRNARLGQGVEESGFTNIGQANDAAFQRHGFNLSCAA